MLGVVHTTDDVVGWDTHPDGSTIGGGLPLSSHDVCMRLSEISKLFTVT